jgi:hypothetical protein
MGLDRQPRAAASDWRNANLTPRAACQARSAHIPPAKLVDLPGPGEMTNSANQRSAAYPDKDAGIAVRPPDSFEHALLTHSARLTRKRRCGQGWLILAGGSQRATIRSIRNHETAAFWLRRDSVCRQGEVPPEEVPPEIAASIGESYLAGRGGRVVVRSSATAEDLPGASFAGQHDNFLNVEGVEDVVDASRRCWGTLEPARSRASQARG